MPIGIALEKQVALAVMRDKAAVPGLVGQIGKHLARLGELFRPAVNSVFGARLENRNILKRPEAAAERSLPRIVKILFREDQHRMFMPCRNNLVDHRLFKIARQRNTANHGAESGVNGRDINRHDFSPFRSCAAGYLHSSRQVEP